MTRQVSILQVSSHLHLALSQQITLCPLDCPVRYFIVLSFIPEAIVSTTARHYYIGRPVPPLQIRSTHSIQKETPRRSFYTIFALQQNFRYIIRLNQNFYKTILQLLFVKSIDQTNRSPCLYGGLMVKNPP